MCAPVSFGLRALDRQTAEINFFRNPIKKISKMDETAKKEELWIEHVSQSIKRRVTKMEKSDCIGAVLIVIVIALSGCFLKFENLDLTTCLCYGMLGLALLFDGILSFVYRRRLKKADTPEQLYHAATRYVKANLWMRGVAGVLLLILLIILCYINRSSVPQFLNIIWTGLLFFLFMAYFFYRACTNPSKLIDKDLCSDFEELKEYVEKKNHPAG